MRHVDLTREAEDVNGVPTSIAETRKSGEAIQERIEGVDIGQNSKTTSNCDVLITRIGQSVSASWGSKKVRPLFCKMIRWVPSSCGRGFQS